MVIKDLQPFQQWQTWKTYIIDNRDKISENSNEFLRSLMKSLKVKYLHSMTMSMRMLLIKMRNLKGLKNDIFDQQSWGFFQSTKYSLGGVL